MASDKRNIVLAFDVYGTLLSTASIAQKLGEFLGDDAKAKHIAAEWRKYQLEYTWRLNSMNQYLPFSTVTARALRHALAEAGAPLPPSATASLLTAYDALAPFPDALAGLDALRAANGNGNDDDDDDGGAPTLRFAALAFSNGTRAMVESSLAAAPGLAPRAAGLLRRVVVVDDGGGAGPRYKPAPEAYEACLRAVGVGGGEEGEEEKEVEGRPRSRADVWLVSGNPFDVVGARAAGMNACWVDRAGTGWVDGLAEEGMGPEVVVRGLDEVVGKVRDKVLGG
ncbi:HAD-like domain-containing protein [Lineolata rhizophorae]|uniref:HAD-like domain-containing protein n=1 Tax=Lineolata rhizophorae TaxID=578093 RepID=A0A6A6P7V5_9PEZI|nr:HAD-like domain-containing protein [Lineolata rhizophorae]